MNKYIITIIVALMALGIGAKAQTVYSCQYKSEADVKVHVTNFKCSFLQNTFMPMCLRALPINEYVEKLRGFTTSYSTYSLFYRLPLPLRLNVFCEVTSRCGRRLGRF